MSTDSTELTFVRCPSCRVLVPTVSTRCRMCGASLDASSQSEGGQSQQKSGRVRQHTLSTQVNKDLADMTDKIRDEAIEAADKEMYSSENVEEIPVEDPLSAYIEEVEVGGEAAQDEVNEEELFAGLEDVEESGTLHGLSARAAEQLINGKGPHEEGTTLVDAEVDDEVADESTEEEELSTAEEGDKKRRRRRRRRKKSDSLKEAIDSSPEEPEVKEKDSFVFQGKAGADSAAVKGEAQPEVQQAKTVKEETPVTEPEPAAVSEPATSQSEKTGKGKPVTAVARSQDGRLFGWLVSYTDGDGSSIELRESRFFVTRDSLKTNDLILDHASISTPHAMISLNADTGFMVQDLMSESGIHIKRKGEKKYVRVVDPQQVKNGDWIRFGDVEYMVTLIPHLGVK